MKTYAIVGAGGRTLSMFARPMMTELQDVAQLVGICDINPHTARCPHSI